MLNSLNKTTVAIYPNVAGNSAIKTLAQRSRVNTGKPATNGNSVEAYSFSYIGKSVLKTTVPRSIRPSQTHPNWL
jgi:hypothetical protein